ncbi:hypothetical protein EDB84DRAFT_1577582 [Lactarius hengduanensis]|nr:hypothetical protein EDB84DRAFT_1577582 [Lactarius hengduanensis]
MGTELLSSVGSPSVRPLSSPGEPPSGAISHTQGDCEKQQNGSTQGERRPTTIDTLPDDVLLEIFDFYRKDHEYTLDDPVWKWHLLVHVCQTWRQIIFASPRHFDLKILCTCRTPVREDLGTIWPAFPIIIHYHYPSGITPNDEDNIISALEHHDRVCDIRLTTSQWDSRSEKFDTAVQEPFPVLARLYIYWGRRDPPVLPAKFLGGSAPCLREITLSGIPYPALPRLLLSASDLTDLDLHDIPPTGYISPEAMVTSLATLPRLDSFTIGFRSPTSRPDRIHLPPVTRTVLPALTSFEFWGANEYLEDLVSQIDSPRLKRISILVLGKRAHLRFYNHFVTFTVYSHVHPFLHAPNAPVLLRGCDWHILDIAQLLGHFPTLTNVLHLNVGSAPGLLNRRVEDMADVNWLHFLRQFSTVRMLRLYHEPAVYVPLALEDLPEELVAEVLPSLDFICMEGQPESSIEKFIAARKFSGCPVTVIFRGTEFDERLMSYYARTRD